MGFVYNAVKLLGDVQLEPHNPPRLPHKDSSGHK